MPNFPLGIGYLSLAREKKCFCEDIKFLFGVKRECDMNTCIFICLAVNVFKDIEF